jgi:plastocyanin domain-containing protein
MFLFSVGTVPLMFAFGALSSFLTKKFAGRMMTASAVLVVVLGVFMFGSGASLSGLRLPGLSSITTTQASPTNTATATVKDGVQTITTGLSSGRYEPIIVQKGIPVKWTIKAEAGDINGCNNSIVIPKFNVQKNLAEGDNVIEFTPDKSGTVPYSCWMGMIRSQITVVDDLNNTESSTSSLPDTNTSAGKDNDYIDYQIPTDNIVIGKIDDQGVQTIDLTLDENGLTPAVFVIQKNLETKWNIIGRNAASLPDSTLIFPYYSAQVPVTDSTYTVTLYPDQDFDFFTSDTNLFGYVKVVDDINKIDLEAIKKEVTEYRPQDYYAGGGGLPSCH